MCLHLDVKPNITMDNRTDNRMCAHSDSLYWHYLRDIPQKLTAADYSVVSGKLSDHAHHILARNYYTAQALYEFDLSAGFPEKKKTKRNKNMASASSATSEV